MTEVTTTKAPSKRELFRGQKIVLIIGHNPKKKGTASFDRFEDYFKVEYNDTTTVDWMLRNTAVRMDDIRHDSEHGFIAVGDEAIAKHNGKAEEDKAKAIEAAKKLLAEIEAAEAIAEAAKNTAE